MGEALKKSDERKASNIVGEPIVRTGRMALNDIKPNPYQRAIRPDRVQYYADKIQREGYNESYPVTIDSECVLVDGGHRIEAARVAGLTTIPYVITSEARVKHSLRCNRDGADTIQDDVFDLAELCYRLAGEGWTGQQIADELGWSTKQQVQQYAAIKERLHIRAWKTARFSSTRVGDSVDPDETTIVSTESTIVDWRESHFRALLKHLLFDDDHATHADMRAQVRAIRDILARAGEKDKRFGATQKTVTAAWIDALAQKYAWHLTLARHMMNTLVERVQLRDRVKLLRNIYNGVYGDSADDKSLAKLDNACRNLNEKALGVVLYQDDAFQRLPLLEDGSIALVITDPPYNVTEHEWDKIGTDEEFLAFTRRWLQAVRPKLTTDYHLFMFCDSAYAARIESILIEDGWPIKSRVIWSNRSLPSGRMVGDCFAHTWQMVFHCGTHSLNWSPQWSDERFDVQTYAAPNGNTNDGGFHPTPKPQKFIEHLVRIGSKEGDTVLDLFAGGGTTGAASSSIGQRQCILIERQAEFCSAIERRLNIKREG